MHSGHKRNQHRSNVLKPTLPRSKVFGIYEHSHSNGKSGNCNNAAVEHYFPLILEKVVSFTFENTFNTEESGLN